MAFRNLQEPNVIRLTRRRRWTTGRVAPAVTDVFARHLSHSLERERPWVIHCSGRLPSQVVKSEAIVSHAGMGTILTALEFGKPLIVVHFRGDLQETLTSIRARP